MRCAHTVTWHVQLELAKLQVSFDKTGRYQIKDTRKDYKLSFTCSTSTAEYQFSGGADAVIVPYGELEWQLQTRAIIDWKTPTSLTSVTSGNQQRKMELLGTLAGYRFLAQLRMRCRQRLQLLVAEH